MVSVSGVGHKTWSVSVGMGIRRWRHQARKQRLCCYDDDDDDVVNCPKQQ